MANHYDHNPFDEGVNPFSAAPAHASHSVLSTLPAELADYNHMYGGASLGIPMDRAANLRKKEKELKDKEAELVRREQEVKRREDALARAGIVVEMRNWPPFMPMIHHDIANDIPLNAQRIQYVAFATFLGMMVCLLWNVIAVTAAWIAGKNGVIFFLAIIYFLLGFLSYFSWYRPLYNAFRTDRAWTFGWFFLFYLLHIAYCIYAAVGPPFIFHGIAITGIFSAIDVLKASVVAGIFYFIGFAFFTAEALVSIWVLQQVYMYFRGSGRNISDTWHVNNGGGGVVLVSN